MDRLGVFACAATLSFKCTAFTRVGRRTSTLADFRTREEARAKIGELGLGVMHGGNWAERYHNKGFVIREKVVATEFEFPSRPKPRDKYVVTLSAKPNRPGTWDSTLVEVFRRSLSPGDIQPICGYEDGTRNAPDV